MRFMKLPTQRRAGRPLEWSGVSRGLGLGLLLLLLLLLEDPPEETPARRQAGRQAAVKSDSTH